MNEKPIEADTAEDRVRHCYSTWSTSYYRDYYESKIAYPPVHAEIVRARLKAGGIRSLLDVGCGPASMLRDLDGLGIDRYGFDLTPEMVSEARRVMGAQGVPADHFWQGSVLDPAAYVPPCGDGGFDAAICFGVLPHIPAAADSDVLSNIVAAVRPGGLVMIEARNQLFALFTLNRYSRNFFFESLVDLPALQAATDPTEAEQLAAAVAMVERQFRLDLPPLRRGKEDEPGYDEVLSRTHNPFELRAAAEQAGLHDVEISFYHYHCLPPMAEATMPELFRRASVEMENPKDWRGYFMASAFIISGYRDGS